MEILIKATQEEAVQTLETLLISQPGRYIMIREPYSRDYIIKEAAPQHEKNEWRRFEGIAETEADKKELDRVVIEKDLSRRDLAIILFNLRVRPGFQKEDFGI